MGTTSNYCTTEVVAARRARIRGPRERRRGSESDPRIDAEDLWRIARGEVDAAVVRQDARGQIFAIPDEVLADSFHRVDFRVDAEDLGRFARREVDVAVLG